MAKTRSEQIAHHTQRNYLDLNKANKVTNLEGEETFLFRYQGKTRRIGLEDFIKILTDDLAGTFATLEQLNSLPDIDETELIKVTFETVNNNLKSYDYTLSYIGKDIDTIVYDLGGGQIITKTFNYTGKDLTSLVLSDDTPTGISLTKTLTYAGKDLISVTYT